VFVACGAAVRFGGLFAVGVPKATLVASTPESHTLGASLLVLRVGLPLTIANLIAPDGVVATYVPSRIGRPEMRPVKRKRFAPFVAGTSSRPAFRHTGATCLNQIATRLEDGALKANTTLGRRFGVVRPDDCLGAGLVCLGAGLAPLEVWPL
jgi:hypothetical protein